VIDYGCGSGVLGIAAAIKGATSVFCVDNDPQALLATRDNAKRNNVKHAIQVLLPEDLALSAADVVVANILAAPLIGLAPVLLESLKPGGLIVLSGMIEEQADEVAAAYQAHTEPISLRTDDGWLRMVARKKRRQ